MPSITPSRAFAGAVALAALLVTPAFAQQQTAPTQPAPAGAQASPPSSTAPSNLSQSEPKPQYMPPGMMMGPASMSADATGRACDPRSAGFTGWRIAAFEKALDLSEDQKKKLEDFKAASAKALDAMVTDCSTKTVLTPTGQLEAMEKRLAAQLEAVKALRTSFDPFYASLSDEQKARLAADPRGRFWRWEISQQRGGRW
jgi:LTXXQ motif family protein